MDYALADDIYWEFDADCRHSGARGFDGVSGAPSRLHEKSEMMVDSFSQDLKPQALLVEFSCAVVPLSAFVVLYIGFLLQQWILTFTMAGGLLLVIVGLAIFKFGLMTGLMPFGESIGAELPQKASLSLVFLTSISLGVLVTFSEPGINSLQIVGEILDQRAFASEEQEKATPQALLMQILSPQRSFELLIAVAIGVGFAAACGLLRLQFRCGLKPFVFCSVVPLLALTFFCWRSKSLSSLVGLCWDCGAITTGPATVPIVLSMGMGVARTSRRSSGNPRFDQRCTAPGQSDLDGFGIVTLASLVPVFTVMVFGVLCDVFLDSRAWMDSQYIQGRATSLKIVPMPVDHQVWAEFPLKQLWQSCRAVGPLAAFLILIQSLLIREPPAGKQPLQLLKGFAATLVGLFVFNIGLTYGSIPLGEQAGQTLPAALSGRAFGKSWQGQAVIMVFGFVAGFMATVIDLEPCGLGETVERLSGGQFTKRDLIASVATGVGFGIILGFAKVLYAMDLLLILGLGYAVALGLTLVVDEGLCCIAWDSAGVTTGPVTVPLVLSMGVGICGEVGSMDGFGILACASVCPIISVLIASVLRTRVCKHRQGRLQMAELRERIHNVDLPG